MDHFILQSSVTGSTPRTGRVPSNIVVQQAKEFRKRAAVSSVEAVIEVCYVALFQMNYYTVHGGMVTNNREKTINDIKTRTYKTAYVNL